MINIKDSKKKIKRISNKIINNYWEKYYKKKKIENESNFAKFVVKFLKKKNSSKIADIGCGNGRDTIFFLKKGFDAYGFDQSKTIVNFNKKNVKKFFLLNFCKKKINIKIKFDNCYLRFFLHTITNDMEKKLIKNLRKISNKKTLFFFEFRTINDPLMKQGIKISKYERYTDHYRRFIDTNNFIKILNKNGFKIVYKKTSKRFAITKNENPNICRLVFKNA